MIKTVLAYHADPALCDEIVAEAEAHREADMLVSRLFWKNGKGCSVGCFAKTNDKPHEVLAERTGFPAMLHHLQDTIFEGLSKSAREQWHVDFFKAAKPGADLSLVGWKFLSWLVADTLKGAPEEVHKACAPALKVLRDKAKGKEVDPETARAAVRAAAPAARAVTYQRQAAKLLKLMGEAK